MKILVTGGAGYIGSIMVKTLLDQGDQVIVADSLERGHAQAIDPRADFREGNLLQKPFVEKIFEGQAIDAVIHFAGYISMAESMKSPGMYFENNTLAVVNLLGVLKKQNKREFIFSSTAGVYGNPIHIPINEDHPKNPTNPYGESKLMVERMLSWYQKINDINSVSLRYFNAAGALLDASLGEDHNPETHIIPNAMKAALLGASFTLYGDDYDTPDKTCVRDYIHVIDLVQAHVLALKKLEKEKGSFVYNVGTGKGCSNKEVIDMVKKISGIDFSVEVVKRRAGDADMLVADAARIKKELGFVPQHSELETIVQTAWQWHKKLKMKNEK